MKDIILELYSRPQTVFQIEEIAQLMPEISPLNLKRRLHYFVTVGKIKSPRGGIYTKTSYEPMELANKIFTPSYISFETVLAKVGIVFQYYETIFVASYLSRDLVVDGNKLSYRQISEPAFTNTAGIVEMNSYFIATTERAFLDAVFLYKDYHFDNLKPLNWNKISELAPIYESISLSKRVNEYAKSYKEDYGLK